MLLFHLDQLVSKFLVPLFIDQGKLPLLFQRHDVAQIMTSPVLRDLCGGDCDGLEPLPLGLLTCAGKWSSGTLVL